ncbi:MAG: 2-C-methyl-D-erythritol 4-phosphate cytidylyltransferase [Lachnospiraceae bacterium]|nr:2-C-methyl-D-erythritol 4-phosphate cytidylyltransferase [Lachnospiraceae bacterium]
MKTGAVILAGGSGKRMGGAVPKQYMELGGQPLICYSLRTFQESFIDAIVLVCGAGQEEYCRRELVEAYGFTKVCAIVPGGKERYHSVMQGVKALPADVDYIFIHDGARAFVSQGVLRRGLEDVREYSASVAAIPSRDTVKRADEQGFVKDTPKRAELWLVQTPQIFSASLIREAYGKLAEREEELLAAGTEITDDAMIVELLTKERVHLFMGEAQNIKLTSPEDLKYAEWILSGR